MYISSQKGRISHLFVRIFEIFLIVKTLQNLRNSQVSHFAMYLKNNTQIDLVHCIVCTRCSFTFQLSLIQCDDNTS